jgi:hypothetical protein
VAAFDVMNDGPGIRVAAVPHAGAEAGDRQAAQVALAGGYAPAAPQPCALRQLAMRSARYEVGQL